MAQGNFGTSFMDAFLGTYGAFTKAARDRKEDEYIQRTRDRADNAYYSSATAGNTYTGDGSDLKNETDYHSMVSGQPAPGQKPKKGRGPAPAPVRAALADAPSVAQQTPPAQAPQPEQPWQGQYAKPDWQSSLTKLSPEEEAQFQAWAKQSGAPITDDYDMRGYWKSGDYKQGTTVNQNDGQPHYNDRWKTPLHQSFSGESVYANPDAKPPTWNDKDQLVAPDGRVLFDERAQKGQPTPQPAALSGGVVGAQQGAPGEPAPQGRYLPVMYKGQLFYAPQSKVTQLKGADLLQARAEAVGYFDSTQGAQLLRAAQEVRSGEYVEKVRGLQTGVMEAMRLSSSNPQAALDQLAKLHTTVPDGRQVEYTYNPKDGSITETTFIQTQRGLEKAGSMPVQGNPTLGITPLQAVFRNALQMTTPEGYIAGLNHASEEAVQTANILSTKFRDNLSQKEFDHRVSNDAAQLAVSRGHLAVAQQGLELQRNAAKPPKTEREIYGEDQQGNKQYRDIRWIGDQKAVYQNGMWVPEMWWGKQDAINKALQYTRSRGDNLTFGQDGRAYRVDKSGKQYLLKVPGSGIQ